MAHDLGLRSGNMQRIVEAALDDEAADRPHDVGSKHNRSCREPVTPIAEPIKRLRYRIEVEIEVE